MSESRSLKWCADEIIRFLDIYRKYEGLWDTYNENYMKRNAREDSFTRLFSEWNASGFKMLDEEVLRKKM